MLHVGDLVVGTNPPLGARAVRGILLRKLSSRKWCDRWVVLCEDGLLTEESEQYMLPISVVDK